MLTFGDLHVTIMLRDSVFFFTGINVPVKKLFWKKIFINVSLCIPSMSSPETSLDDSISTHLANSKCIIPSYIVLAQWEGILAKSALHNAVIDGFVTAS